MLEMALFSSGAWCVNALSDYGLIYRFFICPRRDTCEIGIHRHVAKEKRNGVDSNHG